MVRRRSAARPLLEYLVNRIEPVGKRRRARLQNERRLDFVQLPVADRRHRVPTGSGRHLIGTEALAAPRTEDDIRSAAHDFAGVREDAILAQRTQRALREYIVAAGDADQLADPTNSRDERLVPFLEIDARTAGQ